MGSAVSLWTTGVSDAAGLGSMFSKHSGEVPSPAHYPYARRLASPRMPFINLRDGFFGHAPTLSTCEEAGGVGAGEMAHLGTCQYSCYSQGGMAKLKMDNTPATLKGVITLCRFLFPLAQLFFELHIVLSWDNFRSRHNSTLFFIRHCFSRSSLLSCAVKFRSDFLIATE